MSRISHILKYADLSSKGLEISPYYSPIVSKGDGYDVVYMDIVDAKTLRDNASRDPMINKDLYANIFEVDIVGNAIDIESICNTNGLSGNLAYIISSHNFEHLPDPIKFLQGCFRVLAPGGVLSMALPDCRATLDHFRFPTRLDEWLQAFFENRRQPTQAQAFDQATLRADYFPEDNTAPQPGCGLAVNSPVFFRPNRLLEQRYRSWVSALTNPNTEYEDVHCSVMFNATFELMLHDLRHLGLIEFDVLEISPSNHHEFYVHLKRGTAQRREDDDIFYENRERLLKKINQELGWWAFPAWRKKQISEEAAAAPRGRRLKRALKELFRS